MLTVAHEVEESSRTFMKLRCDAFTLCNLVLIISIVGRGAHAGLHGGENYGFAIAFLPVSN